MFNYQTLKPLNTLEDLFGLKGRVGLITGGAGKLERNLPVSFLWPGLGL